MCIIQSSTTSQEIFWKHVYRIKPNMTPCISIFTHPTTPLTINNNYEKAHISNQTFACVFVKPKPIPSHFEILITPPETTSPFNGLNFSVIEVFNILEKLNTSKSPEIHGFANEMIKK